MKQIFTRASAIFAILLVIILLFWSVSRIVFADSESEHGDRGDEVRATGQSASATIHIEQEQENENIDENTSATEEDANENAAEADKGDEHRHRVENVVHELENEADKNEGISDDLNEIADEEASSSEAAANAMHNLDREGSVKKFFWGPNFGSLGELRSTLVTTQNHIDRLTRAENQITDPAAKATLETQINALKDIASSTQEFIDSHEKVFSLFGWLLRLFSK